MKKLLKLLCLFMISIFIVSCNGSNTIFDEPTSEKASSYYIKGDVNNDGKLTVNDITDLIDYMLANNEYDSKYDINNDGKISVEDLSYLIDLMLTGTDVIDGIYVVNNVEFRMIAVEGGSFIMGANNTEPSSFTFEKPQHEVILSSFKIAETEVTQALWKAVMGTNPSINKTDDQNPVEYVSWNDCITFIESLNTITGLNFRLPTEAEWEYAAIGGQNTHYYKFSGSDKASDVAWYSVNSGGTSHPVKQLSPNELGIYDMSGNVYEWVNDWYDRYTAETQVNPQGPETGSFKVYRGGAWNIGAGDSRCHFRYMREPTYRTPYHGLRLAL